jgi:hypothetical protein
MLLYGDVLAREQVRDELRYFDGAFANAPVALQLLSACPRLADFRQPLGKREALLGERIDSALGQITTPPFVTLERRASPMGFSRSALHRYRRSKFCRDREAND